MAVVPLVFARNLASRAEFGGRPVSMCICVWQRGDCREYLALPDYTSGTICMYDDNTHRQV
eukprot:47864-Eustigmatos_ZCMA.PRE.1